MSSSKENFLVATDYGMLLYVKHPDGDIERNWIDAVPDTRRFLYKVTELSYVDLLKNLIIHYRSRINKKLSKPRYHANMEKPYLHDKQITDLVQYKNE